MYIIDLYNELRIWRKIKKIAKDAEKKLNEKGVGAASYYPIPVHKTPFYKSKIKLPITEWAASKVLSLPIHPKVTTKNIEFISKSIFEIL